MTITTTLTIVFSIKAGVLLGLWIGWKNGKAKGEGRTRMDLEPKLRDAANHLKELERAIEHQKQMAEMQMQGLERDKCELRQHLLDSKEEAKGLGAELVSSKNKVTELEAIYAKDKEALETERKQLQEYKEEAKGLRAELSDSRLRATELEAISAKDREVFDAERKQFEDLRAKFSAEFENLANHIFEQKNATFQTQSRDGLNSLLTPFKETLESFRKRVDQVHSESLQGQSSLKIELGHLQQLNKQITEEASNLTRALKGDKKLQGNWGEQKVELLLEMAGLRKDIEYESQPTFKDDEGNSYRPDFVVNLPEGKHIIIDSKVSLVDYTAYVGAETQEERQCHLAAHVAAIRSHIKSLSGKKYPDLIDIDSPDFTFLFIALEPAYIAAAEHAPTLFQEAFEERIALVTSTTLLPVIRVVANLWSLQRREKSTQELADLASRVYDKLRGFIEKMDRLGSQLETAQKSYKDAMLTLRDGRGSLVGTAGKFSDLGVKITKKLSTSATVATQDEQTEQGEANHLLDLDTEDFSLAGKRLGVKQKN
ncbi:MAG: DNA recombination protein RmuC [Holophagales bacterium]|jgi:DNA recombination protein RmuC|nr:DNA recombination protein RmuC [Holophagales bacterium]